MEIPKLAFAATDWTALEAVEHKGETGSSYWRTLHFGPIRIRMVEYSAGYRADHWCRKGHVLLCIEGELRTELEDGRVAVLRPGMTYQVGDKADAHRSSSPAGAKAFIVD